MWLRANITLAIAVIFAVVQMFASATGGPRAAESSAHVTTPNSGFTRSVAAQDDEDDDEEDDDDDDEDDDDEDNDEDDEDNDEDDEDNDDDDSDNDDEDDDNEDDDNEDDEDNDDEDDDNEDSDNDDEDDDNEDSDNDDEDSDNDDEDDVDDDEDELDDELDNMDAAPDTASVAAVPTTAPTTGATTATGATGATTTAAAPSAVASPAAAASPAAVPPATEAQLVTSGMDATLALGTDRIVVQVFSTMPAGITVKVKIVDPLTYPATPGIRAGDLIFALEATDATGMVLPTLPGEVNLSVRYTEIDVVGLDKNVITMGRLDPVSNTWSTAPKLMTDPMTNFLAASVMDTGVYAVYVP